MSLADLTRNAFQSGVTAKKVGHTSSISYLYLLYNQLVHAIYISGWDYANS